MYDSRRGWPSVPEKWISRNVRLVLPSPEAVLLVRPDLDRAVDGALVRLCEPSGAGEGARNHRGGAVLVARGALVRSLFRNLRCTLRRLLDGVLAASLVEMVDSRLGSDPVHLLFYGFK